jgi:COP9 signalosome complex subunit 8
MTNFTFDYASLAKILEGQELESPADQTSPQVYGQLLAIYLLFTDLTSAKFLWKRIPDNVKAANNELSVIWSVGKLMWKKNYSEIYRTIDSIPVWPNHLKNIMKLISESTRQRVIELISKAYSSISLNDASQLLGLTNAETLKLAEQLSWRHESDTGFLTLNQQQCDIPGTSIDQQQSDRQQKQKSKAGPVSGLDNGTELLEKLTEYIIFLESTK